MDMDPEQASLEDAPPVATSFNASWTPSKAAALAANNVPRVRTHRAWERKPTHSKSVDGKAKTVWKRYGLRSSQTDLGAEGQQQQQLTGALDSRAVSTPADRSPGRIVKKSRIASPTKSGSSNSNGASIGRRKSSATRYERRKSGYRRKPVTTPTLDASAIPVLDAPAEADEVTEEPRKDEAAAAHVDTIIEADTTETLQDDEEQEESMCEAAEAQLLNEAGLEPIPADFAISPVKKLPKLVQSETPAAIQEQSSVRIEDEAHDASFVTAEGDDESFEDTVQYPILAAEAPRQEPELVDSILRAPESDMQPIRESVNEQSEAQSSTRFGSLSVTYPSIDIFGLDDEELDAPEEQQASVRDDEEGPDAPGELFTISLNDETVNLGALLAKNDNLAATITDDEIQLEVAEAGDDEEGEDSPLPADDTTEMIKEDDSPADSPDELSMDLDATETVTATGTDTFTHLEDDKAKLSSFLRRVAAAKQQRTSASVSRRESLQNRRDSDVVRKALASPRHVLEDKDTNQSPRRAVAPQDNTAESTLNLDKLLSSPLVKPLAPTSRSQQSLDQEDEQDELSAEIQTGSPSQRRRSSRSTRSKLPHPGTQPASSITPNRISVRTDGGEKVNLNRSEAQQLADLVRRNTKKNKGSSVPAPQRLAKIKLDSLAAIVDGEVPVVVETLRRQGVKSVTWREQLAEYATSIATADLEAAPAVMGIVAPIEDGIVKAEPKKKAGAGTGTQRLRKLRALGGQNGTPAKNVLQSIALPDDMEDNKPAAATAAIAKKKRSATTVASSDEPPAPAVEDDAKTSHQRKSKLLPPKKLNLNPSLTSLAGIGSAVPALQGGKENTLFPGLSSPAKKMSKIPAPSGIPAPPVKRVRAAVGAKKA